METRVRRPITCIRTTEQWTAISSAVRLELLAFLEAIGPCSVNELARAMDRPADGLYHHIRLLLAVDLIEEVGSRSVGRQTESIFDLAARRFVVDFDPETGRNGHRVLAILRATWRRAERVFGSAIEARRVRFGDDPTAALRTETAWLDDDRRRRALEHLEALEAIFAEGRGSPPGDGELFTLTYCFSPVVRSRSRTDGRADSHARA